MKNLPGFERALRVTAGTAMLAWSVFGPGTWVVHAVLAASGLTAILTGGAGYCPACAVAGRRTIV